MFQELVWLGAVLALLGLLIVAYLGFLAIKRLVDRRNETKIVGLSDYSHRLRSGESNQP